MKKEARIFLTLVIIFLAAYFMPFSKAGSRQKPQRPGLRSEIRAWIEETFAKMRK